MMECIFRINDFCRLDENIQIEIQDFVSSLTTNWSIEISNSCEICNCEAELIELICKTQRINVCTSCHPKVLSLIRQSLKGPQE